MSDERAETYLPMEAAITLVGELQRATRPLYGLDGAQIEKGSHLERIEWILDLSSDPYAYDVARDFIRRPEFSALVWCVTHD